MKLNIIRILYYFSFTGFFFISKVLMSYSFNMVVIQGKCYKWVANDHLNVSIEVHLWTSFTHQVHLWASFKMSKWEPLTIKGLPSPVLSFSHPRKKEILSFSLSLSYSIFLSFSLSFIFSTNSPHYIYILK